MPDLSPEHIGKMYEARAPGVVRFVGAMLGEKNVAAGLAWLEWVVTNQTLEGKIPKEEEGFQITIFKFARSIISSINSGNCLPEEVQSNPALAEIPVSNDESSLAYRQELREALRVLSGVIREVVVLRIVCELSVDRVGEILEIGSDQVKVFQHVGLYQISQLVKGNPDK